ncbi:MAG: hypothetical protein M1817_004254 [Caeruleum heppii]|nr:MAG: hypothetical protein M1817_004254 [Caeruleum heppii]
MRLPSIYDSLPARALVPMDQSTPPKTLTSSPSSSSLDVPTIDRHVRQVLGTTASLRRIEIFLRSTSLNVSYLLTLSDGTQITLKLPPPASLMLLRHERRALEASVLLHELLDKHRGLLTPRLLSYDLSPGTLGVPFLLCSHFKGSSLRDVARRLHPSEYDTLSYRLKRLLKAMNQITSPAFGTLSQVVAGTGSSSWHCAFSRLVETILRDAEDMVITIPYHQIRDHVARFAPYLDEVEEARLVLLVSDPSTCLVVDEERLDIQGLVVDCPAMWGDPLLSSVFDETSETFQGQPAPRVMQPGQEVRTLLYIIYRSVVQLTETFYRPKHSRHHELDARKRLKNALRRLDCLEI